MKKWEKPILNDLSVRKTTAHEASHCQGDSTPFIHEVAWHCDCCHAEFRDKQEAIDHEMICELCS